MYHSQLRLRQRAHVALSTEQIKILEEVLSTGERLDGLEYLAQKHEVKYYAIRLLGEWSILVYDQKTKILKTLLKARMTKGLPTEGQRKLKRILEASHA